MSNVHIQLLGDFQILGDGAPKTPLNSPRTQALLAFLVLHPQAPQPRYHVAFQLWPDLDEAQARANLRYQLHVLRRALSKIQELLYTDELVLQWRPGERATSDVQEFERALDQAESAKRLGDRAEMRAAYERAVNLYRGDLLPSCYDDWILAERERYRQLFVSALDELIELTAGEQEYRAAIGFAQHLLRHDPLHEATYRRLMRYHAAIGDRVGAVRVYHTCAALLKRELDIEPTAATRQEYERIIRDSTPGTGAVKRAPPVVKAILQVPGAPPNNLPLHLTSFVGRERELAELKQRLGSTRLLTLTGAGGSGKTRLALEAAAGLVLAREFPDGVWWVELEALTDPNLLTQAVLSALGLRAPGRTQLELLLQEHLYPRQALLILDNCEHLLSACQKWVSSTLLACPNVRVLATSREPLGAGGEVTYSVPPLSVPHLRQTIVENADLAAAAMQFEAVRLFVERAVQSLPTFTLNQRNIGAVLDICRRLDGIPLAIELAAARVRVLSPAQIAGRLDEGLALLTHGSRTTLPRHRTLRATLDWSYQLLSEPERVLLRRLSTFAGGFTLEAAEEIVNDDGLAPINSAAATGLSRSDVLDQLSSLVDKSLVVTQPEQAQEDTARYRLLELIRQYAHERLLESREEDGLRRKHGRYYLSLAEQGHADLAGPRQAESLHRLVREHDNFRTALEWSGQGQDAALGLRLGGALARFWWIRGYAREGREQLRNLLAQGDTADSEARGKALNGAYFLEWRLDNFDAARGFAEEYLALQRKLANPTNIAEALIMLANAQGDHKRKRAEELLQASLDLAREIGDKRDMATALNNLGEIARQDGDYARAADYYGQVVALNRELKTPETLSLALHNLGQVALARADCAEAAKHFRASLDIYRELEHKAGITMCLAGIAGVASESGAPREAVRLAAAVESLLNEINGHLDPADEAPFREQVGRARVQLGEENFLAEQALAHSLLSLQNSETALVPAIELAMTILERVMHLHSL